MDIKQSDAHTFQGGPAFPSVEMQDAVRIFPGMTLRDAFACCAMAGYCANSKTPATAEEVAVWAYQNADAMLAERLK
jgi:hypothetical protein